MFEVSYLSRASRSFNGSSTPLSKYTGTESALKVITSYGLSEARLVNTLALKSLPIKSYLTSMPVFFLNVPAKDASAPAISCGPHHDGTVSFVFLNFVDGAGAAGAWVAAAWA